MGTIDTKIATHDITATRAPTGELAPTRSRREDLDRAKGVAILLVVFGHIVARQPPQDNQWYVVLKQAVYLFHMPFFMYLSGYVTFLSGAARTSPAGWLSLVAKRASRLLLPFLLFGLVIVAGKIIAARFLYVDNLPQSGAEALKNLLWTTAYSPATSVWYIAVLFVLCVITPPLIWLARGKTTLLLLVACLLYVFPLPSLVYMDRVATYFLFFVLGGIAADANERWLGWIDRYVWLWTAVFAAAIVIALLPGMHISSRTALLVCGVLAMPALHGLVRRTVLSASSTLLWLGSLSFVIYLLNTLAIGLTKGVMLKFISWDGVHFLLYAPLLMLAGTLAPIFIKRVILRRIPPLDRMTN